MNIVNTYKFQGKDVLVFLIDSKTYFLGRDIAKILGFPTPGSAIHNHVKRGNRIVLKYKEFPEFRGVVWGQKSDYSNRNVISLNGIIDLLPYAHNGKGPILLSWTYSAINSMKTIKDIARMASTNVQAVYRYINKHNVKPKAFDENKNHAKMYDNKTAAKIADQLAKRKPRIGQSVEYQALKKQLGESNSQIRGLNETIRNLNTTIETLRSLLALEKKSNLQLTNDQKKLIADSAALKEQSKTKDQQLIEVKKKAKDAQDKLDKINHASLWSRITKNW